MSSSISNTRNDGVSETVVGTSRTTPTTACWADLSFPFSDLFMQEIGPKYLTIRDFVSLGSVSRKYRDHLGARTAEGNRILGRIVLESARHRAADGEVLFTEQLPTIGRLSVEESLAENAVLVATLRRAALRRRSLITFPVANADSEPSQQHWVQRRQIVSTQYRPQNETELSALLRKYGPRRPAFRKPRSSFVVLNLSGGDVYVHWVDHEGNILVRDGDRLTPCQGQQEQRQPASFEVRSNAMLDENYPPHVFNHSSYLYHSFALCFSRGGPPFAIYQQRRGYYQSSFSEPRHTHAIAILPGGEVQELHCDTRTAFGNRENSIFRTSFRFICRQTGIVVRGGGAGNFTRRSHNDDKDDSAGDDNTIGVQEGNENNDTPDDGDSSDEFDHAVAENLANAYYGFDLPSVDESDFWFRTPLEIENFAAILGGPPTLGKINPLGEVMYQEWVHTNPAETWNS